MPILKLRKSGILVASNNEHKIKEIVDLLSPYAIPVFSPKEMGIELVVEETGTTFFENAKLKAEAYYHIARIPTIADDSGLEVDALNHEPGVYSSIYGGVSLNQNQRNQYLLEKMKNVAHYLRTARFVCVIAFKWSEHEPVQFYEGITEGRIIYQPRGSHGFGYDPIFEEYTTKKTFAEMTLEEKNQISHRAKALRNFLNHLLRTS
ncbi:MAG: RdgB/HAM1 family non-canonical purine NTP pyrophosphatase [Leptospiraceae bacterium]|nr:RdgB/HAM1 family non-canonical purine NTP pyrophosphatase [Leptospiraceae bacterium]MDW7975034.1 RdgB/HAM1 family non-canonical purine NTP pyrophosphatase [Leptospiraceae bacterium]